MFAADFRAQETQHVLGERLCFLGNMAPRDLRSIESRAVCYNPVVAAKRLQHRFKETLVRLGG